MRKGIKFGLQTGAIYDRRTNEVTIVNTQKQIERIDLLWSDCGTANIIPTEDTISWILSDTLIRHFQSGQSTFKEAITLAQKELISSHRGFLKVEFVTPSTSPSQDLVSPPFEASCLSASSLLKLLAFEAGKKVVIEYGVIKFIPYDESKAPLITEDLFFPPSVFSRLDQPVPKGGTHDVSAFLKESGLSFERKGSKALYTPATYKLTITNTEKKIARLDNLVINLDVQVSGIQKNP
jgi:hypothetical protein